jgi:thioredoxin reductase (NADPH)
MITPMDIFVHSLIIIGSGPAGLTAAIYASRAMLTPLVIEGNNPGGQLMGTSDVENFPGYPTILGPTLMNTMRQQAQQFGTQFLAQSVTKVDFSKKPFTLWTDTHQELQAHCVIVATGASPLKLGCPGEDTYWGKGVTVCAVCDGFFYQNKKVLVIGGGDTAMEDASFLKKFTKDITVVQIMDTLTASEPLKKRILNDPDITVLYNSTVTEIKGDDSRVTGATIKNTKTGVIRTLPADGIFIAIGQKPNTAMFTGQLALTKYGYLAVENHTKTSVEGVFAAGDVFDYRYRQAITAAGSGCMAALDAERYLKEQGR